MHAAQQLSSLNAVRAGINQITTAKNQYSTRNY
jgi:hypothetical protein